MTISSVMQCQVLKMLITAVMAAPAMTVIESDLSNLKTWWMTVAVATSMERSSPGRFLALRYLLMVLRFLRKYPRINLQPLDAGCC